MRKRWFRSLSYGIADGIVSRHSYIVLSILLLLTVTCRKPEVTPHTFRIVSACSLPGYAKGLDLVGNLAYVADDQGGLQIIDIANPDSTFVIGSYNTVKAALGVAVRDSIAYVALNSNGGLMLLNIKQPSNVMFISQDGDYYAYRVVAPQGDTMYVYIAARYYFKVESVVDPTYPSPAREFSQAGSARGIAVVDSMVYLGCEQMGIHIYNLAKPDDDSAHVGWIDTPGNARNVAVNGDYAYVADGRSGLTIIDVSNPASPQIISTYDAQKYANDVFVDSNFAYIADAEGGLEVIDISNPVDPIYYGSIETPYAYSVSVRDSLIYLTDRDLGLVIISEE